MSILNTLKDKIFPQKKEQKKMFNGNPFSISEEDTEVIYIMKNSKEFIAYEKILNNCAWKLDRMIYDGTLKQPDINDFNQYLFNRGVKYAFDHINNTINLACNSYEMKKKIQEENELKKQKTLQVNQKNI